MKRILSVILAVVMVLSVMCSFSFAAEAPEEESDETMGSVTYCPLCGGVATVTTTTTDPTYEACPICKKETKLTYYIKYMIVCSECGKSTDGGSDSVEIYLCGCK